MIKTLKYIILIFLIGIFVSCEEEIRNIAVIEPGVPITSGGNVNPPVEPPIEDVPIIPIDINEKGFKLLSQMQGHWIGSNRVIADDFEGFSFDYRAISASHIHGIYEGGTIGNLLTSFFITDFKGTRTIMARNGGLLNGIYRSSYFVLDSLSSSSEGDFYRLVDAEGGTNTMWMELRFKQDSLYFNAYTSRLGLSNPPTRHMTFKAKREHIELAQAAAQAVGFPQNELAWDFSEGFMEEYLYAATEDAKSATFLSQGTATEDVFTLAARSGDPFPIDKHPYLAYLQLDVVRDEIIKDKQLFVYLSMESLTDENGYFYSEEVFNTVLLFPDLLQNQNQLLITYLHPGNYYLTVIADVNEDGYVSSGDYTHISKYITIDPEGQHQITIDNINIEN